MGTSLDAGAGGGGGQGTVAAFDASTGELESQGFGQHNPFSGGGGAAAKPKPKPTVALMPWYIPDLNDQRAAELLMPLPAGTFVVRNSSTKGVQAMSIHLGEGDVSHILCIQSPKAGGGVQVRLGQDGEHLFSSVRDLVGYYMEFPPANPRTGEPLMFTPYNPGYKPREEVPAPASGGAVAPVQNSASTAAVNVQWQ